MSCTQLRGNDEASPRGKGSNVRFAVEGPRTSLQAANELTLSYAKALILWRVRDAFLMNGCLWMAGGHSCTSIIVL